MFQKFCLFAPLSVKYVSVKFSTNTAPIGTKIDGRCQWAPAMLVQGSDESLSAFLEIRLGTDTILAKPVFFAFLTNWLRGSTLQRSRQAK